MEQFASTVVVVLLVAAVVAAALGDLKDAVALNGLLGFVQEYRAEQAMAALKAMAAPMVRIRRGGRVMVVPAAAIVPGDLVRLGPGDLLAVDLRLTESWALRVNDAALTGESEPVTKQVEPLPRSSPGGLWQHALWVGLAMAAVCLALLVGARAAGWPWQTMVFTTLALLQLGHALVVRSERESFFTLGARSNPFLLAAVLGAVAVQLAILRRLRRGGAREVDHPPAVPKVPPDTGLMALLHGPRFEQAGLLGG